VKTPLGFAPALPLSALEVGQGRSCRVGEHRLALFRTADGVHALDDRCPHRGSSLGGGHFDGHCVTCPSHGWRFDVRTGRAVSAIGNATGCYEVRIIDGMVCVRVESIGGMLRSAWARWRSAWRRER